MDEKRRRDSLPRRPMNTPSTSSSSVSSSDATSLSASSSSSSTATTAAAAAIVRAPAAANRVTAAKQRVLDTLAIQRDIGYALDAPDLAQLEAPFHALRQQRTFDSEQTRLIHMRNANCVTPQFVANHARPFAAIVLPLRAHETVLRVSVFHPHRAAEMRTPESEFLVLGSQPLSALRDAITCQVRRRVARNVMTISCSDQSFFLFTHSIPYLSRVTVILFFCVHQKCKRLSEFLIFSLLMCNLS